VHTPHFHNYRRQLICLIGCAEQVRSVSVQPKQIPLAELKVAAPRLETRTSVEASMRLDALASAGFRVSRSAMTDLIKKGDVRCVCGSAGLPGC
jgi:RNA-binding protein YlmH